MDGPLNRARRDAHCRKNLPVQRAIKRPPKLSALEQARGVATEHDVAKLAGVRNKYIGDLTKDAEKVETREPVIEANGCILPMFQRNSRIRLRGGRCQAAAQPP
jgi:hypothetical protein